MSNKPNQKLVVGCGTLIVLSHRNASDTKLDAMNKKLGRIEKRLERRPQSTNSLSSQNTLWVL
ncbi:MAG: hypothetical protein QMC24_10825 [Akkermansiaceae bacterium]|jgi:hypothetical protein